MVKSERMELRCSLEEKDAWARCAGGSRLVSDWLRSLANATVENSKLDGLALVGNAIALLKDEPVEPPMVKRAGWEAVAPDVSPVKSAGTPRPSAKRTALCEHRRRPDEFCPRCDTGQAPVKADIIEPVTPTVFPSEKPRAGRRTMMCAHRVPVTAFCTRCD